MSLDTLAVRSSDFLDEPLTCFLISTVDCVAGFGFVSYATRAEVDRVLNFRPHMLLNKLVECKLAEPKGLRNSLPPSLLQSPIASLLSAQSSRILSSSTPSSIAGVPTFIPTPPQTYLTLSPSYYLASPGSIPLAPPCGPAAESSAPASVSTPFTALPPFPAARSPQIPSTQGLCCLWFSLDRINENEQK